MATLRDIKRRVESVDNISQITSAMQMVAASRMKKAQRSTQQFQPYARKIAQVVGELSIGVDRKAHKLLGLGNPKGKKLLVLITTDKGLCGALNSNLFREVKLWHKDLSDSQFITIGKKGVAFIRGVNYPLEADFSGESPVKKVSAVASLCISGFLSGKYSSVKIIFNRFINTFTQQPVEVQVLPILGIDQESDEESVKRKYSYSDFLLEPSVGEVLEALLPEYVENVIRDAMLSADASEFSARMMAMKNATDNAKDLSFDLTLEYNKIRQSEITMSIADMVTARIAIE